MNTSNNQKEVVLREKDFSYTYNAEGYMIQYKGKNIGGAGIIGKSKSRGKARQADLNMYRGQAENDIAAILTGSGSLHYWDAIEKINAKNLTP